VTVPYIPAPQRSRMTHAGMLERPKILAEAEFNEYPVSTFLTGDELRQASE